MNSFFKGFEKQAEKENKRSVGIPAAIGLGGLGVSGASHLGKKKLEENIGRVAKIKRKLGPHMERRRESAKGRMTARNEAAYTSSSSERRKMYKDWLANKPGADDAAFARHDDAYRKKYSENSRKSIDELGRVRKNKEARADKLRAKKNSLKGKVRAAKKGRIGGALIGGLGLGVAGYNAFKNRSDKK